MHRIDAMHREQATAILLEFCHTHLRLEKIKVSGNPLNQKKSPNMARFLEKFRHKVQWHILHRFNPENVYI